MDDEVNPPARADLVSPAEDTPADADEGPAGIAARDGREPTIEDDIAVLETVAAELDAIERELTDLDRPGEGRLL